MECTICQIPKHSWSGCPSPQAAQKTYYPTSTAYPIPSHYPLSAADSVKESQLIVKAVYVSSMMAITQCGITNGEWKGGGGVAVSAVTMERTFWLWGQLL